MQRVIVTPSKLWDYLKEQDKKGKLDTTMFKIATNDEFGIDIYASKDNDSYYIVVEADGNEVDKEYVFDDNDAEATCKRFYAVYLTEKAVDILAGMTAIYEDDGYGAQDEIYSRELRLSDCVSTFISDVLDGNAFLEYDTFDEIVEDCKEHFLEYLARKHGLDIYRPMILEDEDGKEFFEEYPYEYMVFDDEDNPIYK